MGSRYAADGSGAVPQLGLAVGDRVRLDRDSEWFTVQAVSANYAACARPLTDDEREAYRDEFGDDPDETMTYTVLDWRNGVRGPCNLIGQGWGDGTYTHEECAAMLAAFERPNELYGVEVSQRNWVPLRVLEHASSTETDQPRSDP